MSTLVLSHADCLDGSVAAWAVRKAIPDAEIHFAKHGAPPPDVKGKRVIFVDFSYHREEFERIMQDAKSVLLLDHHVSAMSEIMPLEQARLAMQQIPLSDGSVAYVDVGDVERVSEYAWSRAKHGGAIAYAGGGRGTQKLVYMHRIITAADAHGITVVDHWNRNTLDNRKCNLRFATKKTNAANMDRGSRWKGVKKVGNTSYAAQITADGKNKHLGCFATPEEAAHAYDAAAIRYFGEFALLNFPVRTPPISAHVLANLRMVFDMERSGAGIAWDTFHPDEPRPKIVNHVEDGDLWRFKIPNTKEFCEAVRLLPSTFESIEQVNVMCDSPALYTLLVNQGKTLLDNKLNEVDLTCKIAEEVTIEGHKVFAANVPYYRSSETGNALIRDRSFGVTWYYDGVTHKYHLSFRSDKNGANFDVAKLAESFGGGGHRNASGAQVKQLPWLE